MTLNSQKLKVETVDCYHADAPKFVLKDTDDNLDLINLHIPRMSTVLDNIESIQSLLINEEVAFYGGTFSASNELVFASDTDDYNPITKLSSATKLLFVEITNPLHSCRSEQVFSEPTQTCEINANAKIFDTAFFYKD